MIALWEFGLRSMELSSVRCTKTGMDSEMAVERSSTRSMRSRQLSLDIQGSVNNGRFECHPEDVRREQRVDVHCHRALATRIHSFMQRVGDGDDSRFAINMLKKRTYNLAGASTYWLTKSQKPRM